MFHNIDGCYTQAFETWRGLWALDCPSVRPCICQDATAVKYTFLVFNIWIIHLEKKVHIFPVRAISHVIVLSLYCYTPGKGCAISLWHFLGLPYNYCHFVKNLNEIWTASMKARNFKRCQSKVFNKVLYFFHRTRCTTKFRPF